MNPKKLYHYFNRTERLLWILSVLLITAFFLLFDRRDPLTLVASLLGATSLIFTAKGNPVGQMLMVIFSLLYGYISFACAYYGEMITYVGMTAPMAVFSLISWWRNPYDGNRAEVRVNRIGWRECLLMNLLTAAVTVAFRFILGSFGTAKLLPSTLSVTTSFLAVYLTLRRSPYYALAYAANDVILLILWTFAALEDPSYASVIACFLAFLANDLYGFYNWKRMEQRQRCAPNHPPVPPAHRRAANALPRTGEREIDNRQ